LEATITEIMAKQQIFLMVQFSFGSK